jgi:MarR family transcriptional regulator, negative regulator of the multidrug operon emrRAB
MIGSVPNITSAAGQLALTSDRPQERAFRSLVRTIGLLDRAMQPHFAAFGISGSQWAALRALYRAEAEAEPGLRVTELSERLLIRPPSVTGVLDRLERAGLVTRGAEADDLRAKCVRLTPKGRRLVEQVMTVHGDHIERVLGGLNAEDCVELNRLVDRLSEHLEGLLQSPAHIGGTGE